MGVMSIDREAIIILFKHNGLFMRSKEVGLFCFCLSISRTNILKLEVYYKHFNHEVITEEPTYEVTLTIMSRSHVRN